MNRTKIVVQDLIPIVSIEMDYVFRASCFNGLSASCLWSHQPTSLDPATIASPLKSCVSMFERPPLPPFAMETAAQQETAKAPSVTTYSSNGCGRASNTRRSISPPTRRSRRAGASPKYFEFYNRCRPHSSVDRMAPERFYFKPAAPTHGGLNPTAGVHLADRVSLFKRTEPALATPRPPGIAAVFRDGK